MTIEKLRNKIETEKIKNNIELEMLEKFKYLDRNFNVFVTSNNKEIWLKFKDFNFELIKELLKGYKKQDTLIINKDFYTSIDLEIKKNKYEVIENIYFKVESLNGEKIETSIIFFGKFKDYDIKFIFEFNTSNKMYYEKNYAGKTSRSKLINSRLKTANYFNKCENIKWSSSNGINDYTFYFEHNKYNEFELLNTLKNLIEN